MPEGDFDTPWHSHPFWQFDYYEDSQSVGLLLEDKTINIRNEKKIILIPPYVTHKIKAQGPYICYAIKFDSENPLFLNIKPSVLHLGLYGGIIEKILNYIPEKNEPDVQIMASYINLLLLNIAKEQGPVPVPSGKATDHRIESAIVYIKNKILEKISPHDVAKHIKMSVTHFTRIFRAETGHTPMEYVRQLRIRKAADMLKFSDMNISQISDTLNFPDLHTFSRSFKMETGVSPRDFRKKKKKT
ncbi:MAG: hypothetical protein A2017_08060 [Lentisphaerae bacterium GWF2_44_16]|nr:MAG: hypothetical protein A2017_08060 [Lentisphaerae bacterium GWF2_44_16]